MRHRTTTVLVMKVSPLPTQKGGKKTKCMEKVLWQELINWSAKKSQEKCPNFRHVRYCTLKNEKGTLRKLLLISVTAGCLWLVFEGLLLSPTIDAFFYFLIFLFADHL